MGNDKLEKYEALDFINEHIIEGLDKKIILQNKMLNDLRAEIKELQDDNKWLNDKDGLYDEVKELQAELEGYTEDVEKLQAENDRLVEQVGSNSSNSSSTHTHTISKEIAEYMDHNEGCGGARLFLIPRDEFNDGEYDNTIYWDDGME